MLLLGCASDELFELLSAQLSGCHTLAEPGVDLFIFLIVLVDGVR